VPTLATTIMIRSPSAPSWAVLELVGADADGVTLPGARPRQGPIHAEALKAVLHVVLGVGPGEVGEGDGPLRLASPDKKGARRISLDADSFGRWFVEYEGVALGFGGSGFGGHGCQPAGKGGGGLGRGGGD